jgi:acetate kinase
LIDDAVMVRLEQLVALAPLHLPHNLAPIRSIRAHHPELVQVACFDSAIHLGRAAGSDGQSRDEFAIARHTLAFLLNGPLSR